MQSIREQHLLAEITRLRRQVMELTTAQTAMAAQHRLLEDFVTMARSRSAWYLRQSPRNTETQILKTFLQETLALSTRMTHAERGSLLLVNGAGQVEDAIFTEPTLQAQSGHPLFRKVLDRGVAGWIQQHRQAVLIPDTRLDSRWLSWPDDQTEIRSVLGVPLFRQETICGVLTLLHGTAQHFTTESLQLMRATATQMATVLENAQIYGQLHHYSQRLDAELDKGRQIQVNFLPPQLPDLPGWDIAAYFQPATQVAGDFYDIFELSNDCLGLIIADVCDKGVGAAFFMGLFRSLMRIFSGQTALAGLTVQATAHPNLDWSLLQTKNYDEGGAAAPSLPNQTFHPLQAICLTNDYIALNHGDLGMFATLFFGILEPSTGRLTYVSGGHEPLPILDAQGNVRLELKATGPAIGIVPQVKFRVGQAQLAPGELLLGYTDGVTEARAMNGEFFTKARLLQTLPQPLRSATALIDGIITQVADHTQNAPRWDDITLLAVRRQSWGGEREAQCPS
ncbi:MAG: GAF domain-containing SpoIIE family protein phosphatase [Cyanobacteria bacterium P01_G01_bin.54]